MLVKKIFWTPQFLRFGLIGVANTVVHGLILVSLIEYFHFNVVMGNCAAFLTANLFSYFMNSYFTFKMQTTLFLYAKFLFASLLSLMLTLLIAWEMNHLGFHYLEGLLVIVFTVPALSYIVMKFWAFTGLNAPSIKAENKQ